MIPVAGRNKSATDPQRGNMLQANHLQSPLRMLRMLRVFGNTYRSGDGNTPIPGTPLFREYPYSGNTHILGIPLFPLTLTRGTFLPATPATELFLAFSFFLSFFLNYYK
jgi:hypothetical protein